MIDSEVPEIRLVKVHERRRNGGGFFWFGKGGTSGGILPGCSDGGFAAALSTLRGRIMVTLIISACGLGAFSVGRVFAPGADGSDETKQSEPFASGDEESLSARDASSGQYRPSGLSMVSGDIDGLTPEQRAAKAKEAEAAEKAAAEAQAKADAQAQAQADAASAKGDGPLAPAAMAAAAGRRQASSLRQNFGKLSQGWGGGLYSGSSLAGKLRQGWGGGPYSGSSLGGSSGLAGGSRLTGGMGREPNVFKPKQGTLTSSKPSPGAVRSRSANTPKGRSLNMARGQLSQVYGLSNKMRMGSNEARSASASLPFDGDNAGSDNSIAGVEMGTGSGGRPSGAGGFATGAGGGGDMPTPVGVGGSAGSQPRGTVTNAPSIKNAAPCARFSDGVYIATPDGGCVPSVAGKNVTPWQAMVDAAKTLLMIATVLMLAAYLLGSLGNMIPLYGAALKAAAMYVAYMAAAAAAMAALVGMMIIGMGQTLQGLIYTLSGALMAYMAFQYAQGVNKPPTTDKAVQEAAGEQINKAATESGAHVMDSPGGTIPETPPGYQSATDGVMMEPMEGPSSAYQQVSGSETWISNPDGTTTYIADGMRADGLTTQTTINSGPEGVLRTDVVTNPGQNLVSNSYYTTSPDGAVTNMGSSTTISKPAPTL